MAPFQEFDMLLAGDYSDDYWSDDVVLTARDLVERFSSSDWLTLQSAWRSRLPRWQHRCADTLSRDLEGKAVPILLEMVEADDDELVITAADSLSATDADVSSSTLTSKALSNLHKLAKQGPVNQLTVDQLMRKLNVQALLP